MLLPLSIYACVVVLLFSISVCLSRSKNANVALLLFAAGIAGAAWLFWNRPEYLVQVMPFSDALFFSNWFPLAVAIAAPTLVRLGKSRAQRIRIAVLTGCMFAVSLIGTTRLFGKPAEVSSPEFYADGTARQTSTDTCSAAAAVTLLRLNEIDASEKDIAEWALSKESRGTHPLGIYRALKLKLRGTTATSSVQYQPLSADELIRRNVPSIINAGISGPARSAREADLTAKYQWEPGVIHSVVFLRRDAEKVWISDPNLGTEDWPLEHFRLLYRGAAIWLE